MDQNNYVGASGGGYVAVVNGQPTQYATQAQAEQAYNAAQTPGQAPASGQVVPNGGATTVPDMLAGLDAAAGGRWNGNRSDPAAVAAAYRAAGQGGGGGVIGAGGVPGFEWSSLGQQQLQASIAKDAAYQAYLNKVFELKDLPLSRAQIDKMAFDAALAAVSLEASLTGPRNAFAQQAVMNGLNANGITNAVDIVAGRAAGPGFQAPQATPEPISFATLAQDSKLATQGLAGFTPLAPAQAPPAAPAQSPTPAATVPATTAAATTPAQATATPQPAAVSQFIAPGAAQGPALGPGQTISSPQAYAAALPAPNKLSARNWMGLGQDTQQFMLGAYEQKGYSANDVNDTLRRLLPQFRAPGSGNVY